MADAPCEGSLATSMKRLDEIFVNFWRKLAVRQEQREERERGYSSLQGLPPATHRPAKHVTPRHASYTSGGDATDPQALTGAQKRPKFNTAITG
ncbi:Hypothetical predicted protein [Pelobates cultripes]|uniref:Uncharacterized protein n=1 Tax=Pelobates cultripes TaxID=61616 RepID=A0AAD1VPX6_PELCU|nr:Hypothetical predicted protein [Pelobates cultripes]